MPRLLSEELRRQLAELPREGAHILTHDQQPTWCYDPSYFVAARDRLGVTNYELALRCGWRDEAYVSRKLGERTYTSGDGRKRTLEVLGYDCALKLTRALGLDFTEVCV